MQIYLYYIVKYPLPNIYIYMMEWSIASPSIHTVFAYTTFSVRLMLLLFSWDSRFLRALSRSILSYWIFASLLNTFLCAIEHTYGTIWRSIWLLLNLLYNVVDKWICLSDIFIYFNVCNVLLRNRCIDKNSFLCRSHFHTSSQHSLAHTRTCQRTYVLTHVVPYTAIAVITATKGKKNNNNENHNNNNKLIDT